MQFCENKKATIQALINSSKKFNVITPSYASKLGLKVQNIDAKV